MFGSGFGFWFCGFKIRVKGEGLRIGMLSLGLEFEVEVWGLRFGVEASG